jgi:hypothetical protein
VLSKTELNSKTYYLLPLTLGVVVFDKFFLGGVLLRLLPRDPHSSFVFLIFFSLPHITASTLSWFDAKYFASYKQFYALFAALLSFFIYPESVFTILYYGVFLWTPLHVAGQQLNLVRRSLKNDSQTGHKIWVYSSYLFLLTLYVFVIHGQSFKIPYFAFSSLELLSFSSLVFTASSIHLFYRASSADAFWAILRNTAMISICGLFVIEGYTFFAILVLRVIHDITAFEIYIRHARNRGDDNFLFKVLNFDPGILTIVLSIGLSYPLTYFSYSSGTVIRLIVILSAFHYITDLFVWRKGTPHRTTLDSTPLT